MPSLYYTLFLASFPFTFSINVERRQAIPADFSSLPSCGQSCLIGAATSGTGGCLITDFQCLANSATFKSSVMKCVISTCSQEDMLNVAKWATKASAALGIPLQLPSAVAIPEKATTAIKEKPDKSNSTEEHSSSHAKPNHNSTPVKNELSTNATQDKPTTPHKSSKLADPTAADDSATSKDTYSSPKDAQSSPKSDYAPINPIDGPTPASGMSISALDFASLPKCGQTCLISAVTTSGGSCSMTDIACLSGSSDFKVAVAKCFMSSCSPADSAASIQWSLKTAASLGKSVQVSGSAGDSTNATIGTPTNISATIHNTTFTPISSGSMMNISTPMSDMPTASLSLLPSSVEDAANSGGFKLKATAHVLSMFLMIVSISLIL